MAKLFKFAVSYSVYGRTAADQFKMNGIMRCNFERTDPKMLAIATALGETVRSVLVNRAIVLQVNFKETRAKGDTPVPQKHHRRCKINLPGQRVSAANSNIALTEIVATWAKDATDGNGGLQLLRGTIFNDEFQSAPDGSLVTKAPFNQAPFDAFGASLLKAFTDNGAELVMAADITDDFVIGARPVQVVKFAGMGLRQETNTRRSIAEEKKDVIQREINELDRVIYKARKNQDGSISPLAGQILADLAQVAYALIKQYGISTLIRYALPPEVKLVLDVAKALPGI